MASTFPNSVDTFLTHLEILASDKPNLTRYQELYWKENRTPTEEDELTNLKLLLRDKIISSDDMNTMQDAIVRVQEYFLNEVVPYLDSLEVGALRTDLGDPANLTTTDKTSAVNAINEIKSKAQMHKLTNDDGVVINYSGNLNTLTTPGRYYANGTSTNKPINNTMIGLLVIDRLISTNGYFQEITSGTTGRKFIRYYDNGSWGNWFEYLSDASPSWTNLTLQNGTTAVTGRNPRYTKVGKRVTIEGEIAFISANTTIGTLPTGFRPPSGRIFKTAQNSATTNNGANIAVNIDGAITIQSTDGSSSISLMGISFYVD